MPAHPILLVSSLAILGSLYCKCDFNGAGRHNVHINVDCNGKGSGVECVVKSDGAVAGKGCFELVTSCPDGRHSAHVCSGVIAPGRHEAIDVAVTRFHPPIHEHCGSLKVEDLTATEN